MSGRSFHFLHASDLCLDQPLHGAAQVPDHLRDLFMDAPYQAAKNLFDTAIGEQVDFVVLAGGVLRPRLGGPRALDFLVRQFLRLQEANIDVYWAGGNEGHDGGNEGHDGGNEGHDGGGWPVAVPLPNNVHRFSEDQNDSFVFTRDGRQLATIHGSVSPWRSIEIDRAALRPVTSGGVSLAVAHGDGEVKDFCHNGITYWALGGRHQHGTLSDAPEMAQYCGSPQGRSPEEVGPHGCLVVEVSDGGGGEIHSRFIATDVVRWCLEPIELGDRTDLAEMVRLLRERSSQLLKEADGRQVFVSWSILDPDQLTDTRSDKLAGELRRGKLAAKVLNQLQASQGNHIPGVWPISLEAAVPTVFPAPWYEEDTVLGDLLRRVQDYQQDPDKSLDLTRWLDGRAVDRALEQALRVGNPAERVHLLRRVAALGVDLLRGDRVLSEQESIN